MQRSVVRLHKVALVFSYFFACDDFHMHYPFPILTHPFLHCSCIPLLLSKFPLQISNAFLVTLQQFFELLQLLALLCMSLWQLGELLLSRFRGPQLPFHALKLQMKYKFVFKASAAGTAAGFHGKAQCKCSSWISTSDCNLCTSWIWSWRCDSLAFNWFSTDVCLPEIENGTYSQHKLRTATLTWHLCFVCTSCTPLSPSSESVWADPFSCFQIQTLRAAVTHPWNTPADIPVRCMY